MTVDATWAGRQADVAMLRSVGLGYRIEFVFLPARRSSRFTRTIWSWRSATTPMAIEVRLEAGRTYEVTFPLARRIDATCR